MAYKEFTDWETCDAMLVVVLVGVARWGWGYVRHCLTGSRMKNLDLRWRGRDRQAARVNGRCHAARARTGLLGSIEVLLFCLLNAREERREKKNISI